MHTVTLSVLVTGNSACPFAIRLCSLLRSQWRQSIRLNRQLLVWTRDALYAHLLALWNSFHVGLHALTKLASAYAKCLFFGFPTSTSVHLRCINSLVHLVFYFFVGLFTELNCITGTVTDAIPLINYLAECKNCHFALRVVFYCVFSCVM